MVMLLNNALINFGCIFFWHILIFLPLEECAEDVGSYTYRSPSIKQLTAPLEHSEGPHWDSDKQVLFFVDIAGQRVYQYDPVTKKLTFAHIGIDVSPVFPIKGRPHKFVIGIKTQIAVLSWDGKNTTSPLFHTVINVQDESIVGDRFNDGKVDAMGRLWIGTMGKEDPIGTVVPNQGKLFRMSANSCIIDTMLQKVSVSNGLVWSSDNRFMYYIDTPTKRIEKFDYNLQDGTISNRRTLFDFVAANIPGQPDGMTIDNADNLWVACFNGSLVINIDSKNGKLISEIKMPVERVTSVTFGGPNFDVLFVTSMRAGLTPEQIEKQPAAGALFEISNLPVAGRRNNPAADNPCFNIIH